MKQQIEKELLAIKGSKPLLQAEEVWKWAKSHPKSALHGEFEWNVKKAAQEYWTWQARRLIAVHVTYDGDAGPRLISLSIDRVKPGGGYRTVDDIVAVPDLYRVMLLDALKELKRLETKYTRVRSLARVWQAVSEVEQEVKTKAA
jgi:hypothetical protein